MDGVVEKRDGAAEDAADYLCSDESERGDHGPAEDGGPQRGVCVTVMMATSVVREIGGVGVARLGVATRFGAVVVAVIVLMLVFVRGCVHSRYYSTRSWWLWAAVYGVRGDARSTCGETLDATAAG